MIFIILSWIYITLVSFLTGCLFNHILKRLFRLPLNDNLHFSVICINGLLFTSFIVSVWVLFFKVSLAANVFILSLAIFSFLVNRNEIRQKMRQYKKNLSSNSRISGLFFLLFAVVLSCISYMPSAHADDAGCFTPLIRWMQEYGTVPGIANLDARLGYNSNWFGLQALYGFDFLQAGIFNDLNGLIFLYTFMYSLTGVENLLNGNSSFLNYLRAIFFLPVLFMYFGFSDDIMIYSIQFFTNPTYDIPVTFILWILFLLFLDFREQYQKGLPSIPIQGYLIILYTAFLITIKLNAAPAVLVAIFIFIFLILKRYYRNAIMISVFSICLIVPWVIKTAIASGYLFFPVAEIDVLDVDWKLSTQAVLYIENSIMTWAIDPFLYGTRGSISNSSFFSVPVSEWFPVWLRGQNYINTIILLMAMISGIGWLIGFLSQWIKHKSMVLEINIFEIILGLTLLAGIILWFTKGPLFRYGYGYLLFICMISIARFVYFFIKDFNPAYTGITILVYFFYAVIYYGIHLYEPIASTFFKKPGEYVVPPYTRHDAGNGNYINIVEASACGYAPLPASPRYVFEYLKPEYRGSTIQEGFVNQRPAEEYKIKK